MEQPATFLADPPPDLAVTDAYDADLRDDGYVNNLTRVWCWRPDVMTSFQNLRQELLADSALSPREVAVIVAATASARGDSYCSLAWGARLAGLSDDASAAAVLRGVEAGLPARESALADWSRRVVRDPNATGEPDVANLRSAGFTDREIFEATVLIALRLAFSTVNDALGARPDRELAENAPPLVRDAVTFGRDWSGSPRGAGPERSYAS